MNCVIARVLYIVVIAIISRRLVIIVSHGSQQYEVCAAIISLVPLEYFNSSSTVSI